jgi:tyrosyl-tRNA synthetase
MILQAYDFLELNRRYGCLLQMGGSDQWGNIVNGIDLTRRGARQRDLRPDHAAADHLGRQEDGQDPASGAVWLNADMLSPYEFWQFWRNTTDADVGRFLKLYTELPVTNATASARWRAPRSTRPRSCWPTRSRRSATGREAAEAAEATAREVFEKGGAGEDLPTLTLSAAEVGDGISVAQLITRSGLAKSGKEAKRLIAENGARMNDAALTDAPLPHTRHRRRQHQRPRDAQQQVDPHAERPDLDPVAGPGPASRAASPAAPHPPRAPRPGSRRWRGSRAGGETSPTARKGR